MDKCFNCKHFAIVKIIYSGEKVIDYCIGRCEFMRGDDLISGDEPSCRDFDKKEEKDELYFY